MKKSLEKVLKGYDRFKYKYAAGDQSVMKQLSDAGQNPEIMIVACCDSRVDPALVLQCDPGDLFVVRNIANIVPPYEKDEKHHGTSAALEFAIKYLKVKHLILFGHSQCGGINALLNNQNKEPNDFINNWVNIMRENELCEMETDDCAKLALKKSLSNCLSFPWVRQASENGSLQIHLWFFNVGTAEILQYCEESQKYEPLKEIIA